MNQTVDYYMAPMEGITGFLFRNLHQEMFPGMTKYYMPFMAPHLDGTVKRRDMIDSDPANNRNIHAVPQILTNHAESFLINIRRLQELGYQEINLNLGCPYPTVVTKGKGSGFLEQTDQLEAFFDSVFSEEDLPAITVKTRFASDEEHNRKLFEIYARYPIAELTIHPRRQKDMYKGSVDMETFETVLGMCPMPVCYNGSLLTPNQLHVLTQRYPAVKACMFGRGVLRNPALVRMAQGGPDLTVDELKGFHDRLYEAYSGFLYGPNAILGHMKELWTYWETNMEPQTKNMKALYKAKSIGAYEAASSAVFAQMLLLQPNDDPIVTAKLKL